MSNRSQNQSKTSFSISSQDFPTILLPSIPCPNKLSTSSNPKPQTRAEVFPSLVSTPIPEVQIKPKKQKSSVEDKKQNLDHEYPTIDSKPSQVFEIGTKEIWPMKKPSKKANLNQSYQIPKTQPQLSPNIEKSSSQNKKSSAISSLKTSLSFKTDEKGKKSSSSGFSQKYFSSQSQSDSENEQNGSYPDFEQMKSKIKKSQQFKIPLTFPTINHFRFQKAPNQAYSTHYEKARVHKYFNETSEDRKWAKWTRLGNLRIFSINGDFNLPSRCFKDESSETQDSEGSCNFKGIVKEYYKTTKEERANQIVMQICLAIFEEVDIVCLQEICQTMIRQKLLKALEDLKYSGANQYFFPNNLETHPYMRTTMILSKYPVKFGHLQFQIKEHENQEENKFYFPLQAFCEFEIMIGRKVLKVGILSCHLRSNGGKSSEIRPYQMRRMQVRCIHDFSKRFDRFFCIGDTNIPSSEKFKNENIWIKRRFVDAFDVGQSVLGGTYMYRTKANVVKSERMDRVWMKKQMAVNTDVKIAFKEVLLQSCKNKGFNKEKMLAREDQRLIYISPSDHEILDISVQFTKYE